MQLRILGCSGGIGANLRTTTIQVDEDILIDCGTGVGDLSLEQMAKLRHIFLTHSHLDHVVGLPLLIDTLFDQLLQQPLILHCHPETYQALETHIFNWKIWPDFFSLPSKHKPIIEFVPISPGEVCTVDGRRFEAVATNHTVSNSGYIVDNGTSVVAFSGDTTTNNDFWQALNVREKLDLLIVECAFSNREFELSQKAKHYCPSLLSKDIAKLEHKPQICITHLKPGSETSIFEEISSALSGTDLIRLQGGELFQL